MFWITWSIKFFGNIKFHSSYTTLCHGGIIYHEKCKDIIVIQFVVNWYIFGSALFRSGIHLLQFFLLLLIIRLNFSKSDSFTLWEKLWGFTLISLWYHYIILWYFFSHIFEELRSSIFWDYTTLGYITFLFSFLFWIFGSHNGGDTLLSCRLGFLLLVVDIRGILKRSLFWSSWFKMYINFSPSVIHNFWEYLFQCFRDSLFNVMHFVLYFLIQIEIGVSFDDRGQTRTSDTGYLGTGFLLSDDTWIWFDNNVLTFVEIESTEFG